MGTYRELSQFEAVRSHFAAGLRESGPQVVALRKEEPADIDRHLPPARHLGASMTNRIVHSARKLIGWQKMLVFRMAPSVPAIALRHDVIEIKQGSRPAGSIPWGDEVLRTRLGTGSRLFALQVDGQLVSYAWVSAWPRFSADELRRDLISETPLVWIWDCVTPPAQRGRGYFPELICHLAKVAEQSNAVIFVRTDNTSSIRGITKAGFKPWLEIAATRWTAHTQELDRFDGGLTLSSRPIFPVSIRVPQRVLHWLLDVFDWDIGPYSGT